jgi:hypothetical protein
MRISGSVSITVVSSCPRLASKHGYIRVLAKSFRRTCAVSQEWNDGATASHQRTARGSAGMWMLLDVFTVFGAALVAAIIELHTSPISGMKGFWRGTLIQGQSMGILTGLLVGFTVTLIVLSRSFQLYEPTRLTSHLHEQRLSVQACLVSGLLLTGTLYLIKAEGDSAQRRHPHRRPAYRFRSAHAVLSSARCSTSASSAA